MPATAAAQVAAALADIGRSAAPDASATSMGATAAAGPAAASVPGGTTVPGGKDIVIQLDPEHLGAVSIRMRISGDKVDIAIHVENSQTLDILSRDRHLLSTAVEAAGGDGSSFMLGSSAPGSAAGQPGQSSFGGQPGSGAQQQGSSAAASFASGDRARRGEDQPPGRSGQSSTQEGDDASMPISTRRGADNSVYV
ncbi:MAG TPA: flagellar hook-length control protein FliK [Lichenihabitans sp.]|jgi:flagellar hook-length control protein FliK|nr:flagellar hook-length control protein FliK [Lichenihabitans sp.]